MNFLQREREREERFVYPFLRFRRFLQSVRLWKGRLEGTGRDGKRKEAKGRGGERCNETWTEIDESERMETEKNQQQRRNKEAITASPGMYQSWAKRFPSRERERERGQILRVYTLFRPLLDPPDNLVIDTSHDWQYSWDTSSLSLFLHQYASFPSSPGLCPSLKL